MNAIHKISPMSNPPATADSRATGGTGTTVTQSTITGSSFSFFFSSRRRHTRCSRDWSQTCALPISMIDRSVADLYGGMNYRRASLVLADLELEAALASFDPSAPDATVAWMQHGERAMSFHHDAIGLVDPDLITASAHRLDRLLEVAPGAPEDAGGIGGRNGTPAPWTTVEAALRSTRAQADVLVPLYRGRLAMRAGLLGEAAAYQAEALGAAQTLREPLLECIALAHARRFDEAREIATKLFRQGALAPEMAASLFVQVRAPALAGGSWRASGRTSSSVSAGSRKLSWPPTRQSPPSRSGGRASRATSCGRPPPTTPGWQASTTSGSWHDSSSPTRRGRRVTRLVR